MTNLFEMLANGECVSVENVLKSDISEISYELLPGKIYEDSFNIFNDKEVEFEANLYSNNNRIILKDSYVKLRRHKVVFQINTTNLNDNDHIKARISIVSDIGDIEININYHIVDTNENRQINQLKTINDYYNLYIQDDKFAKEIFNDKRIQKSPFFNNKEVLTAYDCLSKSSNKDVALIEFFSVFDINIKDREFDKNNDLKRFYNEKSENAQNENNDEILSEEDKDRIIIELSELIDKIKDKELTDNLAIYSIRNNFKNEIAFNIYLKAISNGTIINGLIEKFLISIPKDYKKRMPIYVYKLFFEDKSYSFEQKLNLYENIINVFDESEFIYQLYNNEIRDYAISQIYQIKINKSLIKIYDKILTEGLINKNNSKNILYLLRSYKVIVEDKNIDKVIIKYKEVTNETKYQVSNHIAYVPIFFDSYIMFYEDKYGNRFYNKNLVIEQLLDKPQLEDFCLKTFPDESLLDISKVLTYLSNQKLNNEIEYFDAKLYLEKLRINNVVKNALNIYIIDYLYNKYNNKMQLKKNEIEFLINVDLDIFDIKYKNIILKILIYCKEYKSVFDKLINYDNYLLDINDLEVLFNNIILENVDIDKDSLINELLYVIYNDSKDINIITYLNNNFDRGIEDFITILNLSKELSIDTFDISKKILIRMLSINHSKDIDYVYSLYDSTKDDTEFIKNAYLTKKCIDYFLYDIDFDENVFKILSEHLIKNMTEVENVPIIYSLSFSKYISNIDIIPNNDYRRALIHVVDYLLDKKLIFSYFKKLNKHIKMPYNVMNTEYIEYHSTGNSIPKVNLQFNDNQKVIETDMTRVFMNIFLKKIMVFRYEIINYKIYATNNLEKGVLKEGSLTYDNTYEIEYNYDKIQSTYNYINDAILELNENRFKELKKTAISMITKQEITKNLFNI